MKLPNAGELKPYREMKDSGVEWLGEVPAHWEVRKLRHTIRSVAERNRPDLPLLSVVRERGVVVRDISDKDENHNFIPDDLTNYKVVKRYQFAMNKMKAWQGSYGVSNSHGIVSPAYFVFDIEGANPDYFHTAIRSKAYVPYFTRASDGVRIGQWDLSIARMREISFLVPPVSEQAGMVRFLDHADRRIRRYICAKQKLIGLLEEQKQAVIHQAVTGQIDVRTGLPYPTYKSLGVEWLREVPEHWGGISLGAAADSVQTGPFGSQLHASDYVSGGIPVINPSHMRNSSIEPDPSISISQKKAEELSRHELKPGDIVMARRGEMGRCALVTEIEAGWLCGTGSLRIRPRSGIFVPAYLLLVLNAPGVRDTLSLSSIGATMDNLNAGMVSRLMLPELPFPEQIAIVNFVDKWRTNKDNALDCSRRQIDLLNEYRTRLIADVVTGKLDVREASAELPEEDVPGDAEESAEEQGIKK